MRPQPDYIIRQLESTNSRTDKERILESAVQANIPEFFAGVRMALDTLFTFGIRQVPVRDNSPGQGLPWDSFLAVAHKLNRRELTGNAARDAVELISQMATTDQWNDWYRRILIKDLKCGVSDKTVNKVVKAAKHPEYTVPVFTCQLASDSANHERKLSGEKQIQVKLDGVRLLAVVTNDSVELFSRNGKRLENFGHIADQIQSTLEPFPIMNPIVLDGEIMSSSFQDLMSQVYRKENVQAGDSVLNLFDIVDLQGFEQGVDHTPQSLRSEILTEWFQTREHLLPNVTCLGWENVNLDTQSGRDRVDELKQKAALDGYEGLMLKNPSAPYQCKRSTNWLKIKPVITLDMRIVGMEIGTGKNSDRLGALICECTESGRLIQSNVGSGFSDDKRSEIWAAGDSLLDHIVEVAADAVTRNQDGSYSLRFPRFRTFRGFEPNEKI